MENGLLRPNSLQAPYAHETFLPHLLLCAESIEELQPEFDLCYSKLISRRKDLRLSALIHLDTNDESTGDETRLCKVLSYCARLEHVPSLL